MKRFFILFVLCLCFSMPAIAASYSKNSDGLYVDSDGNIIVDLWDDEAGIYIVNGVGYAMAGSSSKNSESESSSTSGTVGVDQVQSLDASVATSDNAKTAEKCVIYKSKNVKSKKIATLKKESDVIVLEFYDDGWCLVKSGKKEGYAKSEKLIIQNGSVPMTSTQESNYLEELKSISTVEYVDFESVTLPLLKVEGWTVSDEETVIGGSPSEKYSFETDDFYFTEYVGSQSLSSLMFASSDPEKTYRYALMVYNDYYCYLDTFNLGGESVCATVGVSRDDPDAYRCFYFQQKGERLYQTVLTIKAKEGHLSHPEEIGEYLEELMTQR